MAQSLVSILFIAFVAVLAVPGQAQEDPDTTNFLNGYPCVKAPRPCQTYVHYRAQSPNFLSLSNISDLFATSRFEIALASNLTTDIAVVPEGRDLLVPVTCRCMNNYSQSNVTYQIVSGDTFYILSTCKFGNLTTYQAIEMANPTLIVTDLQIGTLINLPVRCQCPTAAQLASGITTIVTYVVHPGDTFSSIAKKFGANLKNLKTSATLTPYNSILIPMPTKPVLTQPRTVNPPPPSPSNTTANSTESTRSYKTAFVAVSIAASIILVIALCLLLFCLTRIKRIDFDAQTNTVENPNSSGPFAGTAKTKLRTAVANVLKKLFEYSFEELQEATDNFCPECCIQDSVYKGVINGKSYAIKLMKGDVSHELKFLQKVNHTNLVRLEGVCVNSDGQSYLVYEFLENGSLDTWLHDPESLSTNGQLPTLPWRARLQVALDIACGLQYIHEHTNPTVVHKDIKSSNILLDSGFRAKIANFGMAKSGLNALTKHIIGTQGYMAPEYLADGRVTPKLDIFAFGVILLELISGKEAIVRENGNPLAGRAGLLWTHVEELLEGDGEEIREKLRNWVDVSMRETYCIDNIASVAMVAKACVEEDPYNRPSVAEIVLELSNALHGCYWDDSVGILMPVDEWWNLRCGSGLVS